METLSKIYKHNLAFIVVAAFIALIGIMKFQGMKKVQFFIMVSLVVVYLIWAIIYHYLDKSLSLEVVLEYVLTAALAIIFLYGTLL